jgi:phytoene synthase
VSAVTDTQAAASLKRNGKTFWLASLFLPAQTAADATQLYAFCRKMDDLADLEGGRHAAERLAGVRLELRSGQSSDPVVHAFLQLAKRLALDLQAAEYLLNVLVLDAAGPVLLKDQSELLRYCYGAAGTVGLMMAGVLNAEGTAAGVQAIDLGIAMQLTNIARDVQEDARAGRRYLPATWVGGLEPEQIGIQVPDQDTVEQTSAAIAKVLALADVFYASGAQGFPAIPSRARTGIRFAAAAYRQIGVELARRKCDFRAGRIVVSLPAKLKIAARVVSGSSNLERLTGAREAEGLHAVLDQYPGFA